MQNDIVIAAQGLSKNYVIGARRDHERYAAFRDVIAHQALSLRRAAWNLICGHGYEGGSAEAFWALRGIDFAVKRGEVVGIIGRNGAGKSTLLKILSRITEPTGGRVTIKGSVASLLEVGTGFHPELSGRENIYLNGAILGMTRREVRRKFDDIVAFAEVERFLETPVKRYSSGMYVRLAFAVAAHLQPEILIVDEVLAVGDASFQKRCIGKMTEVADQGRTILFVSHNMNAIERLCQRVLWLERGRLNGSFDDVREGIIAYLNGSTSREASTRWTNSGDEYSNEYFVPEEIRLSSAKAEGADAVPFSNFYPIFASIKGRVLQSDPALNIGLAVYAEDGELLFRTFTTDMREDRWLKLRPGFLSLRTSIPHRLLNEGTYRVELLASLHNRMWLLEPGRNAPAVSFSIQGGLSDSPLYDGKRPGLLAPILSWELS